MRSADYKTSCWIDKEFRFIIYHICRKNWIKYIFFNVCMYLLLRYFWVMLCR